MRRLALQIAALSAVTVPLFARTQRRTISITQSLLSSGQSVPAVGDLPRAEEHTHLSTDVHNENAHDESKEAFDELEASAQELHDITHAMIWYLRHADPDNLTLLQVRRTPKRFAVGLERCYRYNPTPSMTYGGKHFDFSSKKELESSTNLYLQLGEKLLLLLNKDVMDRMLGNVRRMTTSLRREGVARHRSNPIEKVKAKQFRSAKYYKHAPFEFQNLRSDVDESHVNHARFLRDRSTIMSLELLMEPNHTFREKIEKKLWEISQNYDKRIIPSQAA